MQEETKTKEPSKPPSQSEEPGMTEDTKMEDISDNATVKDDIPTKNEQSLPLVEKESQKETTKDGDVTMAADGDDAVEY